VAVFDGGRGLRHWLHRCLVWRPEWGWYATALFVPLVAMTFALGPHAALGGLVPASPASGLLWISVLIVAQILVLGGPLGEEFGWRGYALPALSQPLGWRWASITLRVVWAIWHLPLLPFLAGSGPFPSPRRAASRSPI
jgi:membrane protease YdiL (CAAX protease family)